MNRGGAAVFFIVGLALLSSSYIFTKIAAMFVRFRKKFICIVFVLCCLNAGSQTCCCTEAFSTLREYIKESYAGYELKMSDHSKEHDQFVNKLEKKVKDIPSFSVTCYKTLNEYIAFFEDGHLTLGLNLTGNTDSINQFYAQAERVAIPTDTFKSIINKPGNDPITGIWKELDNDPETQFKLAIVPDKNKPGSFTGVLIASVYKYWKPSSVMMKIIKNKKGYRITHYTSRGANRYYDIELNSEKNAFSTQARIWIKEDAKGLYPDSSAFKHLILTQETFFRELSAQTNYLRLPVFFKGGELIERIIDSNLENIISKPYLVIDIRNNTGGTANGFQKLLSYISDTLPHFAQLDYLTKSSPAIIAGYEKFYKDIKRENEAGLKILRDSVGKIFNWNAVQNKDGKTQSLSSSTEQLPNNIKKIIVLQNRYVYSAAEIFVNIFSASPKVHFMGTHTGGLIDKVATMQLYPNIHGLFQLTVPVAVRIGAKEHPIDPIGFPPDIYYSSGEKDWVEQARYLLENNLLPALPQRFNTRKHGK